jgi:hypothetical protein
LVQGELGSVDSSRVPVASTVDGVAEGLRFVLRADGRSALSRRDVEVPAALSIGDTRAFSRVATAPVFNTDVLVGVGSVSCDGAARVLLADRFESGRFITTVVQEASVLTALGSTEAGFPDAKRRLAVASELELEVAVLFTAGTTPVGDGVPNAVVLVVDTVPAGTVGDTIGVTAVPLRHISRGHIIRAPLGRASHTFSVVVPGGADEALAEIPVLSPLALRVLGAGLLGTVGSHTVRGPAALGPVLLAETIPRAETIVVAGNFGRVVQAGTSTSSVVVEDVGPRNVILEAHVTNPVVHIAAVGEPCHRPRARVRNDVAERVGSRARVTHARSDDLDVERNEDVAERGTEVTLISVGVAGSDDEDGSVTAARADSEGSLGEETDHSLERSGHVRKTTTVGSEVVFNPVDSIPDLSVGTSEGISNASRNGRLDGSVDGSEGTVAGVTPNARVETPTVGPLDHGV